MSEEDVREASDPVGAAWTIAGTSYWRAAMQTVQYVAYTAQLVERADSVSQIIAETLAVDEEDQEKRAALEREASQTPQADRFARWKRWLSEVVLMRSVDNLLTYISEAHYLVYTERPEALRSTEQVRLDFVLQHESMDDLLEALSERRVDRLAYKGLPDVASELSKTLGLSLFPSQEVEAAAVLAVDQRNLIVHNRGVVNARWVARHGEGYGRRGERLRFSNPAGTMTQFGAVVRHVDPQLASKYGVARSTLTKHELQP